MEDRRKREFLAQRLKAATEAMYGHNWDKAVKVFATCVKLDGDRLFFRQCLRGCQRKKYEANKSENRMTFLAIEEVRAKIEEARAAEDWVAMDEAAEEGLAIHPTDRQFNIDLGDANSKLGRTEIAAFAYECARLGS